MTTSFTIRELIPDDAPAYVVLRREMLLDSPHAFGDSPDDDRSSDEALIRTHLTARRDRTPRACVAIVGAFAQAGSLASVCTIVREQTSKRRHIALFVGVYTTPPQRGRGACAMVLRAAIDLCAQWEGIEVAQLAVNEGSPAARRLYERAGFEAWGTEPDAVRVDGRSSAEVHMSCRVDRRS